MSRLTNAQLQARLEEAEARAERAEAALADNRQRDRFYCSLFDNTERMREDRKDPQWTGEARLVVPDGKKAGDHFWIGVSMWPADLTRFKKDPPDFSLSMSPSTPERAAELEDNRREYLRSRAT